MKPPYIGFVGIKNLDEVLAVSQITQKFAALNFGPMIQVGVQINKKVIEGLDFENNLRLSSDMKEVRSIFEYTKRFIPNVFNVAHYSEKDKSKIIQRILHIFGETGIYFDKLCQAVQLDGYLGDIEPKTLRSIKNKYPDLAIIMQVNRNLIGDFSDSNIDFILNNLKWLSDFIGYCLIDCSGGEGRPMNLAKNVYLALRIRHHLPDLAIGFSGGLNGENAFFIVSRLMRMLKSDNFSIDAESGLRNKLGDGYGNDIFNKEKIRGFFRESLKAFGCGGMTEYLDR